MTRILIVTNTLWEADALVAVFSNRRARPPSPNDPPNTGLTVVDYPFPADAKRPIATIPAGAWGPPLDVEARLAYEGVEVWCVSDLFATGVEAASSYKAIALAAVAQNGSKPDLVIAFGTAAFSDPGIYDGCVVVGSEVFNYSPYKLGDAGPGLIWQDPSIGTLSNPPGQPINPAAFSNLTGRLRLPIESRFLIPPIHGAPHPILIAGSTYVAISDVNVSNINDYAWADKEAVDALKNANPRALVGSVETTHGIIYAAMQPKQFLFVSAIANRLGYFNMEAAPRNYAQDFAVAHNAAVALAWLLPTLLADPSI